MVSKKLLTLRELVLFALLGAIMFCGYFFLQVLPNVEVVSLLIVVYTVVFRAKALIPIYVYVVTNGIVYGFAPWWLPYLYIWAVLWAVVMLLPKFSFFGNAAKNKSPLSPNNKNSATKPLQKNALLAVLYAAVSGVFGLAFGALYMPAQALMFGLSFNGAVAWWLAGLIFDITHCAANFALGFLVLPLAAALSRLKHSADR
ncbi:MAG: hypothetical protein LBM65_04940 [Oscillospiraceae bacterium]|jgi:hypothetical protein|nr:hypothetical protein [Oscillospiraceae bacterium]